MLERRDKAFNASARSPNCVVQVLRLLFAWGKPRDWLKGLPGNPAREIPFIRRPRDARNRPRDARKVNRAWKPYEADAVLAAAAGGLRVGIALGAYAGLSEGGTTRFPWNGYDGRWIRYTRRKNGNAVALPARKELREILVSSEEADRERRATSAIRRLEQKPKPNV